jgi:beta-1,4-mannosyl-glycoprotein beta-1,4-N-acetylglucosaminyltransferase
MIYDCFTFFNELDLLEIRLNILDGCVDRFVLVEATKTHQGKDKPLYFSDNKNRFSKFLNKIIHVVVKEYPNQRTSAWVLERHQRNMISSGLTSCKPDDIILVSDVDEIPNPEKIIECKSKAGIKILLQKMYYYYMNCVNASMKENFRWPGTVMCNYSDMISPQRLRDLSIAATGFYSPKFFIRLYVKIRFYLKIKPGTMKVSFVDNGGWHFSYLGGTDAIIKKIEAFAHQEYNTDSFKDAKNIEAAIRSGKDIFGRNFFYKFVPVDESFPKFIRENQKQFAHLIKN